MKTQSTSVPLNLFSKYAPALTMFGEKFYLAFVANDGSKMIHVTSSDNGENWIDPFNTNISSDFTPSMIVFNDLLYLAYVFKNELLITSSSDGKSWSQPTSTGNATKEAPSITVFNDKLYIVFLANNNTDTLLLISSSDGINWGVNKNLGQYSNSAPTISVLINEHGIKLYIAFLTNDAKKDMHIMSSSDGEQWSTDSYIENRSRVPLSLYSIDGYLFNRLFISGANSDSNLIFGASLNGTNWNYATFPEQSLNFAPIVVFNHQLFSVYVNAHSNNNQLYLWHSEI